MERLSLREQNLNLVIFSEVEIPDTIGSWQANKFEYVDGGTTTNLIPLDFKECSGELLQKNDEYWNKRLTPEKAKTYSSTRKCLDDENATLIGANGDPTKD